MRVKHVFKKGAFYYLSLQGKEESSEKSSALGRGERSWEEQEGMTGQTGRL